MDDSIKYTEESELLELVGFNLGKEEFGVEILQVNEILRMLEVTKIPNLPYAVEGIVNVRGKIIPIIDTRQKLNMPQKEFDSNTRIIVVEIEQRTIGFIVDEVTEVIRISKDKTEAPPDLVANSIDSDYITSIARLDERLIIILDLKKIIHSSDFAMS